MVLSLYDINEIKTLIEVSNEDLMSSKTLLEIGQYRNSVVLSYYSMYFIARALLLLKGSEPSTHTGLISEFGRLYVVNDDFDKDLASEFSKIRVSRENASYASIDTFDTFDSETTEYTIDVAKRFRIEANKFLPK